MIALIQYPGDISLSKNQMIYKFRATDDDSVPYGPVGASAQVTTNTNGYQENDTLSITWTEPNGTTKTANFIAHVITDPDSDVHIQAQPSGLSDEDYFNLVASKIQKHPWLSPFFTVQAIFLDPEWSISITANDIDPDWVVSFIITGVDAGSSPSTTSTGVVADNTPENYELLVELFFQPVYGEDYVKVADLSGKPDKDGYLSFDIQDIINKQIRESFITPPMPVFGTMEPQLANNIRKHYVRYKESYEGVTGNWTYLGFYKTLCGGIKKNLFADFGFFFELNETNSLLTWYPDGKTVSEDQPEYLAWYNYHDEEKQVMLEVLIMDADGNADVLIKHDAGTIITVPEMEVLLIPVGYSQLELELEAMDIVKYSVRVIEFDDDPGLPVGWSQYRSFYVDKNHYEDKRYIAYFNGFCVPETLRCLGQLTKNLTVDRKESQKILEPAYQSLESEIFQYDEQYMNYFIYRSGYLSKYEVDALQELLIYNDAYEIYNEGYIPLRITDKQYKITQSRQFLHSVEFQAEPRFMDKSYSNIVMQLDSSQEGWITDPGEFWETQAGQSWWE